MALYSPPAEIQMTKDKNKVRGGGLEKKVVRFRGCLLDRDMFTLPIRASGPYFAHVRYPFAHPYHLFVHPQSLANQSVKQGRRYGSSSLPFHDVNYCLFQLVQ